MMHATKRTCLLLLLVTGVRLLHAQTILNGSFENNCGSCELNDLNSVYTACMQNSVGFGTASQLDIMDAACGYGSAENGNWFVGMAVDITGTLSDAFSLQLSAPLTPGNTYTLTYYDRKDASYATNPLIVGISNIDSVFGTQIYLSPLPVDNIWTQRTVTFTPSFAAQYITVQVSGDSYSWTHVDNFSLSLVSGSPLQVITDSVNGSCDNLCQGSIAISAAGGSPPYHYLWQPSGDTSPDIYNLCPGTYIAYVTDSLGASVNDTVNVSVFTAPVVNLGNDTALCSGQSLMLNAGNAGDTYLWQDSTVNQTLSVNQSGTYWVNVSNTLCSTADTIVVSAAASPVVNLGTDTTLCSGQSLILNAGNAGDTYLWQDSTVNQTLSVNQSGTYWVNVSNGICSSSDTIVVSVITISQPQLSTSADTVCSGDSAHICAPPGFVTYQWSNGDSSTCFNTSFADNYEVTVTDSHGCTAMSNQIDISVRTPSPVTVSISGDTLFVYSALSYQWYLNDTAISGATSNTYIAKTPGDYTVQITDTNGCMATSSIVNITGIRNIENEIITVYPNPTANAWLLGVSDKMIGSVFEIFDADGQIVFKSEIRNLQSEIEIETARGVYWLRISSSQNTILKKLVKL